jgi:tRNA (mo5U34)-methyltransferase
MSAMSESKMSLADAKALVATVPTWYHDMELMPGLRTPGGWDVGRTSDLLPWPDLKGKRCLDIGTFDGFFAFEMERRGASEVIATDIPDHHSWDWPPLEREAGIKEMDANMAEKGKGFAVAKQILGSKAERKVISIYDLSPETVGTFDMVVCGDLLLHLRDPLRALDAVRSVTKGLFMSCELLDAPLTLAHPRYPAATVYLAKGPRQWSVPNAAAHRRQLVASGFEIQRSLRYAVYTQNVSTRPRGWRGWGRYAANFVVSRGRGTPHQALLARPAV